MTKPYELKDDPFYHFPNHMQEGLKLYLAHGIEPGGFMQAVLCNNLQQACARADQINKSQIVNIVGYLWNNIPSDAWGSADKYTRWINSFRKDNK